jgi:protein-tyrosine phosphatase
MKLSTKARWFLTMFCGVPPCGCRSEEVCGCDDDGDCQQQGNGTQAKRKNPDLCFQAGQRAASISAPADDLGVAGTFFARRLHPQLLYGRNPLSSSEVEALAAAGVTHVLDLRQSWEYEAPGRAGAEAVQALGDLQISRLHRPIPDGGNPSSADLDAAVQFIDSALARGGVVYVHCRAGRERSGAVLLAWVLRRGGDLGVLQELAPALKPLPGQQAAVYAWLSARF